MKNYLKPLFFCHYWALKRKEPREPLRCAGRSLWPADAPSPWQRMTPKHSSHSVGEMVRTVPRVVLVTQRQGKSPVGWARADQAFKTDPRRLAGFQQFGWVGGGTGRKDRKGCESRAGSMKELSGVWGWGGEPWWTGELELLAKQLTSSSLQ